MEDSLHAIFHQILDAPGVRDCGSSPPSGLLEFLSKIPSYLESCPNIVLSLDEEAVIVTERKQFLFWFLRRLTCFHSAPKEFVRHGHLIQTCLLRLVLGRQPPIFKDLIQEYIHILECKT